MDNLKNNANKTSPKDDIALERLIDNLENEISSIETQEIVTGLTVEELEDRGLIGNKQISITRSEFSTNRNKSGYYFPDDVEYLDATGRNEILDIDFEELIHLKDVYAGQVIAEKKLPQTTQESDFKNILKLYDEQYRLMANIELKRENDVMRFMAKTKGKVVLLDVFIYVVSGDRDGRFTINVSPDKMLATADFFPPYGNGKSCSKNDVMSHLNNIGIKAGINEAKIEECLAYCSNNRTVMTEIQVVEGRPPINGKPVDPVFMFSIDPTMEDFKILPDGRVDYHKKANIQIIKKGSVIAKPGTPVKGIDGFDIYGNVLKAADGEPKELLAGENVSFSSEKNEFIAEGDGQVSVNGNIINVFQHYTVNGDVDYSVGNIDFNGNITIKGMILSGFEVKATGDIVVHKGIESANVIAGRDLKVHGGIIGDGKHIISCGRNLFVNYLQNAVIEVQGDIVIANSCVQSNVLCNSKVILRSQKGAIVGGSVSALGGVEAITIGTEFGTKTEVIVGMDFLIQKTANEFQKAIVFHNENLHKIDKVLTPLLDLVKKGMILSSDKKEKITLIIDKRKQIKKSLNIMNGKLIELEKLSTSMTLPPVVKVSGVIYPDVSIRIKNCIKHITDAVKHAIFSYNKKNDEIDIGSC
jgi:uncharacterized protein